MGRELITVVMTLKNRPKEMVKATLDGIKNQIKPCKLIVVSYGSDNYKWEKELIPDIIRVTRNTELFDIARALNIGIKQADTKYIMLSDIDIILAPDFIQVATKFLKPKQILLCRRIEEDGSYGKISCMGSCTIIDREWLMKVHGMDEKFLDLGVSDCDLISRATLDDYKIIWLHEHTSIYHQAHPKPKKTMMPRNIEYSLLPNKSFIRNPDGWGLI